MRNIIKESKELVSSMKDDEVVSIKFDGLPEAYPLSFLYDLIDFVGGSYSDVESAVIIDDFSAELKVLKNTALKIAKYFLFNIVYRVTIMIKENLSSLLLTANSNRDKQSKIDSTS